MAWYSSEKAPLRFVSNLAWRKIKLIPRGFYVNRMLKGSASLSSSTFSASRRVENRGPPDQVARTLRLRRFSQLPNGCAWNAVTAFANADVPSHTSGVAMGNGLMHRSKTTEL